jgi:hypothetical protein
MKKDRIIEFFLKTVQRMKRFLTSKDLFVFLFFLLISVSLWGLQAMRKTYETTIHIPISYDNLPIGMIQTEKLPEKFGITISDRGSTLLNYRLGKRFVPISIDLSEYADQTHIASKAFTSVIQQQLNSGTQIKKITPEFLNLNFVQLKRKSLEVKLESRIELSQQYTYSDSIEVIPAKVDVFGPDYILDTLQYAYTDSLVITGLKDTVSQPVSFKRIKDISYSTPKAEVVLRTELFTEKMLDIPIGQINVPKNRMLRIFPSVVRVSFQLGLSHYDTVTAQSFDLSVDYQDILINGGLEKLSIKIEKQPESIFNVRIFPNEVDYLIEIKEQKVTND